MNSRLYYITGSGGELPASAADTIGVNDENIVQSHLEFECVYCGKAHKTKFALPADPEKEFHCSNCENKFRLFAGLPDAEEGEGYKATDIRRLPEVLDDRERVRRLALATQSPIFDVIARGIPRYIGTAFLVAAFVVLGGAALSFGSTVGQGLTLLGFTLLIIAAAIPALFHASARRAARQADVYFEDIEVVMRNKDIYDFAKKQQKELRDEILEE